MNILKFSFLLFYLNFTLFNNVLGFTFNENRILVAYLNNEKFYVDNLKIGRQWATPPHTQPGYVCNSDPTNTNFIWASNSYIYKNDWIVINNNLNNNGICNIMYKNKNVGVVNNILQLQKDKYNFNCTEINKWLYLSVHGLGYVRLIKEDVVYCSGEKKKQYNLGFVNSFRDASKFDTEYY